MSHESESQGDELNRLFFEYASIITSHRITAAKDIPPDAQRLREQMARLCHYLTKRIRQKFPSPDRAGGEKFDLQMEKLMELTDPRRLPNIDNRGFSEFYRQSVYHDMLHAAKKFDRYKTEILSKEDPLDHQPSQPSFEGQWVTEKFKKALANATAKELDSFCKLLDGMSHRDIADQEGVSKQAITDRLHKLYKKINQEPGIREEFVDHNPHATGAIFDEIQNARASLMHKEPKAEKKRRTIKHTDSTHLGVVMPPEEQRRTGIDASPPSASLAL